MDVVGRRKQQRGWALVVGLFLLAGGIAGARLWPVDPHASYLALVEQVEGEAGQQLMHRRGPAFVAFLPNHGYHLSLFVGDSSRFAPTNYIVVNRVDDDLSIDLMEGVGEESVRVLRGEARQAWLDELAFDLAPLDALFERRFTSAGLARQRAAQPDDPPAGR